MLSQSLRARSKSRNRSRQNRAKLGRPFAFMSASRHQLGSTTLRMETLEPRVVLTGDIIISEFMAVNNSILDDEDGSSPDWIELFNNSTEPVNIGGWYLTDDAQELTKWQFPDVTIGPDEFMVVFASDKDRRDPDSELHTNFKLTSAGEYLGLIQSDGTTMSHEYGTVGGETFPEQLADISYGVEQTTLDYNFVTPGAEVGVLIPTSAGEDLPPATWTAAGFNDGAWSTHNLGVGFDGGGELLGSVSDNGNLAGDMQGNTASAYVRAEFNIDGAVPDMDALAMNINYDDGYIAYLNGVEVASSNAPAGRDWSTEATQSHGGALQSVDFGGFSDEDLQSLFTMNGVAQFVGDRLQVTRSSASQTGATWLTEPLHFGADYTFSTSFAIDVHSPGGISFLEAPDGDGNGGQGMTFVLQAGGPFQLGGGRGELGLDNAGMTFVAVEFDTFTGGSFDAADAPPTHIGIDTSAAGNVASVGVPRFNGGSQGDNPRHVWIDYDGFTGTMDIYFSETDAKPADPTLSSSVDLESLFGGAPTLWAGFTGATSFNWNAHEVMDWDITTFSSELGLTTETVDLTEHLGLLQPGQNVLAIHGLNLTASDDDFLVDATLDGALNNVTFLDQLAYFTEPTPGGPNGSGSERPASKVEFSVSGRTFTNSVTVELAAAEPDPDVVIRYTTDGTLPNEFSDVYTGPMTVTETTRFRARSFEEGLAPGPVQTQSYIQLAPDLTSFEGGVFESNLPIFVLDSFGDGAANSDALNFHGATALVYDVGPDGIASLADEPDTVAQLGMRIRGQSSQGWPKKQYALEFWDESIDYVGAISGKDGPDDNVRLLDLPRESDWVLQGPYSDKTQLNNYMAFNLYRDVGLEAPRVRLVEAFVNVNGGTVDFATDYRGTYILLEKNKIDNNRTDIPDPISDPEPFQDPTTVGGYMFKQDKDGAGDVNFRTTGHGGPAIPLKFHDPDTPNDAQQTWLTNFVNKAEEVLYSDDFADPENGYAKYYDVDSFIDHWLITELAKEIDGYRLSEYFYLNREGKIAKGPAWDFNLSFSNANYLDGGIWTGFYYDLVSGAQRHWYPRLFQDPAFESRLQDRWFELRQDEFSLETLLGKVDDAVAALTNGSPNYDTPAPGEPSNPISRNYDRWNTIIDDYLWPNCFFNEGGTCRQNPLPAGTGKPNENNAPDSYDDYIFIMRDFITNRVEWIDSEFGRPPQFDPPGGIVPENTLVTLTSDQPGTIYYTTDGTDPRQPQTVETETTLVPAGAPASVIVPADSSLIDACTGGGIFLPNHGNCFISPNYTEGTHGETWIDGNSGIGFGFPGLVNTDIQGAAQGTNATAYMRIPFEVTAEQKNNMTALTLNVRYDDGFAAYLWQHSLNIPVEVTRQNAPGNTGTSGFPIFPADYNAAALTDRDDALASDFVTIDISNRRANLRVGTNYLVLQALNNSTSDDSMLLDIEMTYTTESIVLPDNVIEYTDPITIDQNMVVIARTFDAATDKWSSRSSQTYFVDVPPIVVTELNYNPAAPTQDEIDALYGGVAADADNDDFEFMEIMNVGSDPYDLTGVTIADGVNFTFESGSLAAGERGVIVRNQTAFEFRYGAGINILGSWGDPNNPASSDKLNNDGEHILIQGPLGEPTMDFTYNDAWYPLTDGGGFTLVIADPNANPGTWGEASSWRPSDFLSGSPGTGDAGIAPLHGSVIVNEVVANSSTGNDAIEFRNTTGTAVGIGNFFLTDDPADLEKFVIPAGTMVPANGYLVIDTTDIGNFALADTGGRIVLQAANAAGEYLGFQTDRRFDAAFPDTSEGVYTTSIGNVDFVNLTSITLGSENAGPTIGPVVISEIMYNPSIGEPEWFELKNISASTVNLGADRWVVVEGIDYAFPSAATLEAGGFALLVQGTDGGDAQATANAFRADNNVPAGVSIYVYEPTAHGTLDNAGEDLAIGRSLTADVDSPAVRFELIEYDNTEPWPTEADGTGSSLTRIDATSYGNEPGNWGVGGFGGSPGEDSSFQDLTPPTMPTDVRGNLESTGEIVIAWGPSVDPETGVDHYNIYRDGALVGTSPYARFVDSVTFTSAPIVYTVSAVNGDGVESTISDTSVEFSALSLSFQEGVNGYTGAADLEIRDTNAFSPVGQINVDGEDSGGKTFGLLRWENLTAVPEGGVIVGIEIGLSVVDNSYSTYQAQQLLRPWDEDTATWTDSGFGDWVGPGASGPGDVGEVVGEVPGSSNGAVELNAAGVAMVQSWIDNPAENFGVILNEPAGGGTDGLDFYSRENPDPNLNPRLTILFVQPPTPSDLGDLDVDGTFDIDDINLLGQGIQNGATDSAFDIDGSGVVDTDDITEWLSVAGNANIGTPYVLGDADLDGDVDSGDLNIVGINWRQNVAGWSQADFNADGVVSASDLNDVGINWQHGVAAAASAGRVPRAPLAAQVDAAHEAPADAVIPAEIMLTTRQSLRTASVNFQPTDGTVNRDEVTLTTRYQIRKDSHRFVSGQQDDSEQKDDVFADLADDIFAAW